MTYARRRGLIDLPGKRRSHTQPTPRGGGIGIVAAILLAGVPAWGVLDPAAAWIQPAAFAAAVLAQGGWFMTIGWATLVPLAVVLVGSVNAHNFMDGIDGILGQQGLFVLLGYGLLASGVGHPGLAALAFAAAAGCLGFLLFNFPPARIFMGDVGSGALGLAIGAVAVFLVQRSPALLWACAILPSAFLVDSGLTLARRMSTGQRWYAPHRQHLYQWLVRVNWSHARTDDAYMIWNQVVVATQAWLAARWPARGIRLFVAAYALAIVAWHLGKRACLVSARKRYVHETA
jgi:UDP-N-acetylmuramyl pentapeptide phosphotransferase/UDP-N-acetylglucosamine-1-phosphate transferase